MAMMVNGEAGFYSEKILGKFSNLKIEAGEIT